MDVSASGRRIMNSSPPQNHDLQSSAPITRAELMQRLSELGIRTVTVDHAPVFTVSESETLEREIPGGHTKNLFLKDNKGAMYLVVAASHTAVDLKALARRLGAGRFSFGKPDLLMEVLGVTPGSVTAFAAISDRDHRVSVVVDDRLMQHETVNCHPLDNAATTNIARDDLFRFLSACGHAPQVMPLGSSEDDPTT